MASMAQQLAADEAAVEAIRRQFGDAEAAKLAADLYKLRRTPAPSTFAGFPRWAVVGIALWLAVLETADKLPQVLLAYPRYEAALADVKTKLMQPDLTAAQLTKAQNDATASVYQTRLAAATATKAELEADAYKYYPDTSKLQLEKAGFDTLAASFQPQTAETQLTQLQIATKKAGFDLPAAAAAAIKAEQNAAISNSMMTLLGPIFSSLAGPQQGKVQSIINPDQRLNELQGSMAVEQTGQTAPVTAPPPALAPAPAPPVETHRPPSKKAIRNNDPRKVGAIVAQPIAPESVTQNEFEVGQQDARDWHTWYVQQNGHAHEGAAYAYNAYLHNVLTPDVCEENPAYMTRAAFHAACDLAYGRLIVIAGEERRDSQYSSGFNHGVVSK
jgi:hypothetical protein